MKKYIAPLLIGILTAASQAQAGDLDKAFKTLNAGEYDKAYLYLHEEMHDDPRSVAAQYGLGKFFSSHDNKYFNLDSATIYITRAYAAVPLKADDKTTKKYLKYGVRDFTIESLYNAVNKEAYDKAAATNTFESFENFIKYCKDEKLKADAVDKRDAIKFDQIKEKPQIETLKAFLNDYPLSKKVAEANELYERMLYESMTKDNTYEAYKAYVDQYPTGPYVKEAQANYDKKLYEYYVSRNNLDSYILFAQNYTKSPYLGAVQDSIYTFSTREHRAEDYNHFIKNFPSNRNILDAWNHLYDIYTQHATDSDYIFFQKIYPNSPFKDRIQQDIYLAQLPLVPFKQSDGKYGYINTANLELTINPQYSKAYEFSGGLAAVALSDCDDTCYFSFIDKTGKVVINKSFSTTGDFVNGKAIVAANYCGKDPCHYGTIDRRGDYVIPPVYEDLQPISEGLYAAHNQKGYGFIDEYGKVVIPFIYQDATSFNEGAAAVQRDSVWIFISQTGTQLFPKTFTNISAFSSGLASVTDNDSTYGYIDKTGNWAIQPIYEYAEPFEGDTAVVSLKETNKKSKDYGLSFRYKIDKTGRQYYKILNPNAVIATKKNTPKKKKK
jgi:hypothetical protein